MDELAAHRGTIFQATVFLSYFNDFRYSSQVGPHRFSIAHFIAAAPIQMVAQGNNTQLIESS